MTVTASQFNTPIEALFDRTAVLVPKLTVITASGTWTKDALAVWIQFFLKGGGGGGGATDHPSHPSGAGAAGYEMHACVPAAFVPSGSHTATIGAGGKGSASGGGKGSDGKAGGATGGQTLLFNGADPTAAVFKLQADGGQGGLDGDSVNGGGGDGGGAPIGVYGSPGIGANHDPGAVGGNGGNAWRQYPGAGGGGGGFDGKAGGNGGTGSSGCPGGKGGNPDFGGDGGVGYGAGGGGGSPGAGSGSAGCGGGGGGWGAFDTAGTPVKAGDGADAANVNGWGEGGDGKSGIIVIVEWCGKEVV